MSSPEIETAFKEAWCQEIKIKNIAPSGVQKGLHARGYEAGAKAERVKVIREVEKLLVRCTSMSRGVDSRMFCNELKKLESEE